MLTLVRHLTLVDTNRLAAPVAVLGKERVEAGKTERPAGSHDVPAAAQLLLTFGASEVGHVPCPALRFCALVSEDELVAGRAAGFHRFRVVTAAI